MAAAVLLAWALWRPQPSADRLQAAWSELAAHIEETRGDQASSALDVLEDHRMEPMPTWDSSASGLEYVGMLEVQAADVSVPVVVSDEGAASDEASDEVGERLPQWLSGSCYAGNLVVQVPESLEAATVLRSLELGDEIQLTTVEGVTFLYGVSASATTPTGGSDLVILLVDEDGTTTHALSCQLVW